MQTRVYSKVAKANHCRPYHNVVRWPWLRAIIADTNSSAVLSVEE